MAEHWPDYNSSMAATEQYDFASPEDREKKEEQTCKISWNLIKFNYLWSLLFNKTLLEDKYGTWVKIVTTANKMYRLPFLQNAYLLTMHKICATNEAIYSYQLILKSILLILVIAIPKRSLRIFKQMIPTYEKWTFIEV